MAFRRTRVRYGVVATSIVSPSMTWAVPTISAVPRGGEDRGQRAHSTSLTGTTPSRSAAVPPEELDGDRERTSEWHDAGEGARSSSERFEARPHPAGAELHFADLEQLAAPVLR